MMHVVDLQQTLQQLTSTAYAAVLSQFLYVAEVGPGTTNHRQRVELLRWTQFARRPQLPLSAHVHELNPREGCHS